MIHQQSDKKSSLSALFNEDSSKSILAALALIFLISLPLLFFYLGGWSFLEPDEGRYGSIPYQMLTRNDFITPTQNGVKFFDKPPLLYWAIAASYAAFGYDEWAARLVPALAALASIFSVYACMGTLEKRRSGCAADDSEKIRFTRTAKAINEQCHRMRH